LEETSHCYDLAGQFDASASDTAVIHSHDAVGNVTEYLSADAVKNTFTKTVNTLDRADGYKLLMSVSETTSLQGQLLSRGDTSPVEPVHRHRKLIVNGALEGAATQSFSAFT